MLIKNQEIGVIYIYFNVAYSDIQKSFYWPIVLPTMKMI